MAKPRKSSAELRDLILSEIAQHRVCPAGMDVVVEAVEGGWRVLSIPPGGPTVYADCVDYINRVARKLRQEYDLSPEPRPLTGVAGDLGSSPSFLGVAAKGEAGTFESSSPMDEGTPWNEKNIPATHPDSSPAVLAPQPAVSNSVLGGAESPLPLRQARNYDAGAMAATSKRAPFDFQDGDAVTIWLHAQPPDVAQVFATRAAMRAFPSFADLMSPVDILRVFRCLAVSWATAAYPGHRAELQTAARSVTNSVNLPPLKSERAAVMAAASGLELPNANSVILAATSSANALDAIAVGDREAFPAMLRAFEHDAASLATGETILTQGFSPVTVAHQGLWPAGVPLSIAEEWEDLKSYLYNAHEDWGVWTEWYDARLLGHTTNQQDDIARAMISDEILNRGPKLANAHIKALLQEKQIFRDATAELSESPIEALTVDSIPEQLPLGSQFGVDASGRIDLVPDPPSLAPLADGLQREMYGEVRHKALGISALGHNQLGDLLEPVDRFVAALPDRLEDVSIIRLWSRANTLRRRLKAHGTASASSDPTDPARLPALVAETLSDLVETYNIFIIGDPRGLELDQARAGPRERDQTQAIVQAAVPIAEAIRSSEGVATASAAEALVEQIENAQGAGAGLDADQAVDLSRKTAINFVTALLRVAYVPIRRVIAAGGAGFAWKEIRAGTYRWAGPAGLGVTYLYRQEVVTFIIENASSLKVFVEQAFHNPAIIRIIELIASAALS